MNIRLGFEFARVLSWLTASQKCKNVKIILTRKLDTRGKNQYLALILFRWAASVVFLIYTQSNQGELCDTKCSDLSNYSMNFYLSCIFKQLRYAQSIIRPKQRYNLGRVTSLKIFSGGFLCSLPVLIIALLTRAPCFRAALMLQ